MLKEIEVGNCYCHERSGQGGFVALTSVSFLSAFFILLFVGMFISATERMERNIDKENSIKALSLTTSCAEIALKELTEDSEYEGGEMKSIDGNLCEIKDIEMYGTHGKVVKTEAEISGQTKRLQIEADAEEWPHLRIIAWRQVSDFTEFEEEEEEEEEENNNGEE